MHHPFAAQVDPRTGLLQFRLPLVTAIGNDHLGPEFTLSLSYSLLHLQDVGYGKGFDDNLSRYDPESRLLTLSNGEQYRLEGEASEPAFCPPAPLHIRLKMLNGALWIYYKSGAVEQLIIPQAKGIAQKYYLLNRFFSPAGHEILFTYIVFNGRLRLAQIKDAQQSLVEIKWPPLHQVDGQPPAPNHIILTAWPGLAQSYSLLLQKDQGKLTRVSQCEKDSVDNARCRAGALCEIGYDNRDRLTSLRLPGGINENFVYCADGAVRPLPCIASHTTRVTDNQRELYRQTQTFQFTDVDFLTANAPLSRPDMLTPGKIYHRKSRSVVKTAAHWARKRRRPAAKSLRATMIVITVWSARSTRRRSL